VGRFRLEDPIDGMEHHTIWNKGTYAQFLSDFFEPENKCVKNSGRVAEVHSHHHHSRGHLQQEKSRQINPPSFRL
jgi:hypothetical protein